VAKSAVDVFSSAFEHTRKQLTEPFRFSQWWRLAILGLATGEISSTGGCGNFRGLGNLSRAGHHSQNLMDPGNPLSKLGLDPATIAGLIIVAIIGFLILGLIFLYISSISRFMLFESILRKHCELTASWDRWQQQGLRFFGWQLALSIISLAVGAMLFLPLLIPVLAVLRRNQQPDISLLIAFLPMISAFLTFGLIMLLIKVFAKDFVVPVMAIDNVGVLEAWRRVFDTLKADFLGFAGYLGMKILLAIGAGIFFGILGAIVVVVVSIPIAIVAVVLVIAAKAAGLGWGVFTITAAIVAGVLLFGAILYLVGLVCVPIAVFFPAYAMYFFGERYPALGVQLFPAPAAPPLPPTPAPLPAG
jgi:hypothetical protein